MLWNKHKEYEGLHAFMSPSQFYWIKWDNETLEARYYSQYAQAIGTAIHALAQDCINSRTKLTKNDKHLVDICLYKAYVPKIAYDADSIIENLASFVNDAIGFRMSSEILLFYSENCFGTADAISYNEKQHILRIHDLKTGSTPADLMQLKIYAALFYLEYKIKPEQNKTITRIYQNNIIYEDEINYVEIESLMNIIKRNDNYLQILKGGVTK